MAQESRNRNERAVAEHGPAVFRLAFAQLRNKADAEDVYQEVFLRFVEKAPAFESAEHEKAWLLRVTLNCCKDLWRSPWRKRSVPLEEDLPFEAQEEWDLHAELMRLPQKYRSVLHLFYWEDMTTEEISRVMDCTPEAVRQRLRRGREKLKNVLDKEELHCV